MSAILTPEKFRECVEDLAFDRWGDSELFAHDAALRAALAEAQRRFLVISPAGHAVDYEAWRSALDQIDANRLRAESAERERESVKLDYHNCADVGRRLEVRLNDALARAESAERELTEAREVLTAIRDYEPREVAKDEFAYDRMVEAYRLPARTLLAREAKP